MEAVQRFRYCCWIMGIMMLTVSWSPTVAAADSSAARLAREGQLRQLGRQIPIPALDLLQSAAWTAEIHVTGARWLRLEITNIVDDSQVDYSVLVLDGALKQIASYPKQVFKSNSILWGPVVRGGYAARPGAL